VKAAVYSLMAKRGEMLAAIRQVMKGDKTLRFHAEVWPVFDDYRADPEFLKAIAV
jgi:hypothetical protein